MAVVGEAAMVVDSLAEMVVAAEMVVDAVVVAVVEEASNESGRESHERLNINGDREVTF